MAVVDFVVAVASVVVVARFLRRSRWDVSLGIITTAVSTSAALMFTIGAIAIGAFGQASATYGFIVVAGLPGYLLLLRLATIQTQVVGDG